MAEALILEFDGIGLADYEAVNSRLAVDPAREETWPEGMLLHVGAAKEGGGLMVVEVWESREAQGAFMAGPLGAALQGAGVAGPPARMEWLQLGSYGSR